MIYDTIISKRTIRKFKQDKIPQDTLVKLIEAARQAPSAANMQPLKYVIVNNSENVAKVFNEVKWAGYLAPNGNPKSGEEPTAYILILVDNDIKNSYYAHDIGASAQNIMLTAFEMGIGSCWMGAIDRENILSIADISDKKYILDTVIALGYTNQSSISEDATSDSIKYYLDGETLRVPKRKMEDILIKEI